MGNNKEWVCLVHGNKALPVCGLCISKPDPEREAMERVVEASRFVADSRPWLSDLMNALSALDRARGK